MNNGIAQRYRPGVLNVSPRDEAEMPDTYTDAAIEQLRTDKSWIAEQIAESVDDVIADLLMDTFRKESVRDAVLCNRLRAAVNRAIEREAPDLAESLWLRDVCASQIADAEYSADCREEY